MGLDKHTKKLRTWIPAFAGMTILISAGVRAEVLTSGIECVSLDISSGPVGLRTNYRPKISGDGRFIVFESRDQSIPIHRSKFRDIYFYDRNKAVLKKIETPMERSNSSPAISESGRYIVYQSHPLSVLLGEPPLVADIFVYDRYLNKSSIQSFGLSDANLDGENLDPVFSTDGRYLVFTSNAMIYPGLKNGITRQVYLYDHDGRYLELISKSVNEQALSGEPGNRPSADPRVSKNGRYVAFKSAATNLNRLLPLDSLVTHLYLLDRRIRRMTQVDDPALGFDSDHQTVGRYDMDNSGDVLVLESRLRNLDKPLQPLSTTDLYVYSRSSGTLTLLTTGLFSKKCHSPTISGDGRFVGFVFRGAKEEKIPDGLIIYDRLTDKWTKLLDGMLANPAFSKNGQYITFESNQPELVPGAMGSVLNIYVIQNPYFE